MNLDAKLTANFKLKEFTKSSISDYQVSMIKILAQQLQIIRDLMNNFADWKIDKAKSISLNVSSGVRSAEDYERLKAAGYNPSASSDHFCGYQPNTKPTLGAADIQFSNLKASYQEVYASIVKWCKEGKINFGQIILEHNPAKGSYWIHFGNDPKLIYSEEVSKSISRNKFITSMDNGKTYKKYEG